MAKQTRSQAAKEAAAAAAATGAPVPGVNPPAAAGNKALLDIAPSARGNAPPGAGVGAGVPRVAPPVVAGAGVIAPVAIGAVPPPATAGAPPALGAVHPITDATVPAGAPTAIVAAPAARGISRIQQGPNINIQPRTESILLAVAEEMRAMQNEAAARTTAPDIAVTPVIDPPVPAPAEVTVVTVSPAALVAHAAAQANGGISGYKNGTRLRRPTNYSAVGLTAWKLYDKSLWRRCRDSYKLLMPTATLCAPTLI